MKTLSYQLSSLLDKVQKCLTYRYFSCLEEDLNNVGLTIAKTVNGRLILCKIKDKKPCIGKLFEDFVFLTESENIDESINEKASNTLIEFITQANGAPAKVSDKPRSWQHGPLFYGGLNIPFEVMERILQDYNGSEF